MFLCASSIVSAHLAFRLTVALQLAPDFSHLLCRRRRHVMVRSCAFVWMSFSSMWGLPRLGLQSPRLSGPPSWSGVAISSFGGAKRIPGRRWCGRSPGLFPPCSSFSCLRWCACSDSTSRTRATWSARLPWLPSPGACPSSGALSMPSSSACPSGAKVVLGFVRDLVIVCASIFLSFVVLELPWNPDFLSIDPKFILVNLALVGTPIVAVYLIGGRRGAPLAVLPAAFCILGIAQYFLCIFKSSAIRPSDVFALQTALSVSGGFSYELGGYQVLALGICSVTVAMLSFVRPQHLLAERGRGLRLAVSGACAACGAGVLVAAGLVLGSVSLSDDLGFTPISWNSVATYRSQGFAGSFVTLVQHASIAAPDGYTESGAEDLLQEYVTRYPAAGSGDERARGGRAPVPGDPPHRRGDHERGVLRSLHLRGAVLGLRGSFSPQVHGGRPVYRLPVQLGAGRQHVQQRV